MSGGDELDDYKSTGSVLEKLSLFEKLEQRQLSASATASLAKSNSVTSTSSNESPSSSVRRSDELSKSICSIDKDPGTETPRNFKWNYQCSQ